MKSVLLMALLFFGFSLSAADIEEPVKGDVEVRFSDSENAMYIKIEGKKLAKKMFETLAVSAENESYETQGDGTTLHSKYGLNLSCHHAVPKPAKVNPYCYNAGNMAVRLDDCNEELLKINYESYYCFQKVGFNGKARIIEN